MTIHNFDWEYFWDTYRYASVCEIGMLICFALSWRFSILKMLKSGAATGKSPFFLWLTMFGFLFGIGHKLFVHLDVVIFLYVFLFLTVFSDLTISRAARRREQEAERLEARKREILRRRGVVLAPGESAPDSFFADEKEKTSSRRHRRSSRSGEGAESESGGESSRHSHRHSHFHRHSSRRHSESGGDLTNDSSKKNRNGDENSGENGERTELK